MSEFWLDKLQTYAAVALLFGAFMLMIDFIGYKLGLRPQRIPTSAFAAAMLAWPLSIGIIIAALCYELNRRRW